MGGTAWEGRRGPVPALALASTVVRVVATRAQVRSLHTTHDTYREGPERARLYNLVVGEAAFQRKNISNVSTVDLFFTFFSKLPLDYIPMVSSINFLAETNIWFNYCRLCRHQVYTNVGFCQKNL